jgi:succinyl-diaminopimelate desuccinylase
MLNHAAAIDGWIERNFESVVKDLQDFARIPSVSRADLAQPGAPFGPDVKAMLDYALRRAGEYGFEAENHEGYCGSAYYGDRGNALGIFGHLDVVPVGEGWIYPPYGATRVGDYLVGRGVHDNKLACAMGLGLMRMFRELGLPLRHGIRLVMGGSEETGMQDIVYFAETQRMPVASIVPDSAFPVNYAQKGMLGATLTLDAGGSILAALSGGAVENMVPPSARAVLTCALAEAKAALAGVGAIEISGADGHVEVVAHGMAAHAARPWFGVSAIHILTKALAASGLLFGAQQAAMEAVSELTGDYYGAQAGIEKEDPETGKTTMVVGLISMADGRIRLTVDCRLSIATDLDACRAAFEAYAREKGYSIESFKLKKPFYIPKDDPRIQALQRGYREFTGRDDEPYTSGGGTYSRELKNAVTFGPSFPDSDRPDFLPEGHGHAHEPDEVQSIPEMKTMLKLYALALQALDGASEGGEEP